MAGESWFPCSMGAWPHVVERLEGMPLAIEMAAAWSTMMSPGGILKRLGVDLVEAGNGAEAIERLRTMAGQLDLVLMDCQMPVMDGYTATRRILEGVAGAVAAGLPIVAMTANALEDDRRACLDAGMDDHVPKPIVVERVIEALHRWSKGRAAA